MVASATAKVLNRGCVETVALVAPIKQAWWKKALNMRLCIDWHASQVLPSREHDMRVVDLLEDFKLEAQFKIQF